MKPKYTATDLFRLKKPLKLLAAIEDIDPDYVDYVFKKMDYGNYTSRGLNQLFIQRPEFRSLVELRLPELTKNMLTVISKEYKIKKMNRRILQFKVRGLHLKNRLLPLSKDTYEHFAHRSQKHFRLVAKVRAKHFLGKGGWDGNNQGNT
jgi:hypothetical protein